MCREDSSTPSTHLHGMPCGKDCEVVILLLRKAVFFKQSLFGFNALAHLGTKNYKANKC